LVSAIKNFASVAVATVKNFAMSISNSGVQYRTVLNFHFRFLGNKFYDIFLIKKNMLF